MKVLLSDLDLLRVHLSGLRRGWRLLLRLRMLCLLPRLRLLLCVHRSRRCGSLTAVRVSEESRWLHGGLGLECSRSNRRKKQKTRSPARRSKGLQRNETTERISTNDHSQTIHTHCNRHTRTAERRQRRSTHPSNSDDKTAKRPPPPSLGHAEVATVHTSLGRSQRRNAARARAHCAVVGAAAAVARRAVGTWGG